MDDGPKSQEGNYKDGNKDGKWTWWNEDGHIKSESTWQNGECLSGDC